MQLEILRSEKLVTHPAEIFAVEFTGTGEENGSSGHVDPHGECFRSKQGLERKRENRTY